LWAIATGGDVGTTLPCVAAGEHQNAVLARGYELPGKPDEAFVTLERTIEETVRRAEQWELALMHQLKVRSDQCLRGRCTIYADMGSRESPRPLVNGSRYELFSGAAFSGGHDGGVGRATS